MWRTEGRLVMNSEDLKISQEMEEGDIRNNTKPNLIIIGKWVNTFVSLPLTMVRITCPLHTPYHEVLKV